MKFRLGNYTILTMTIIVVILLSIPSFTSAGARGQDGLEQYATEPTSTAIAVISSNEAGIQLELNSSPLYFAEDGSIQIDGINEITAEEGTPALPYFSTFIAVPPAAEVTVQVTSSGLTTHEAVSVQPVPSLRLWGEEPDTEDTFVFAPGSVRENAPEFVKDATIYYADAEFPGAAYFVSEPMYMRDMRMVELRLYPLQYNPYRRTIIQASRMAVAISFTGADLDNLHPAADSWERRETVWQKQVINYNQAQVWRSLPQSAGAADVVKLPIGVKTYKIEVDQDGIYEIAGSVLAAKGMTLPVEPHTIQMMQNGKSVAYQFVDSNGNQKFDAVDKIRFYGWAFDGSRTDKNYVGNNIFWLWAGGSASNIAQVDNQAGTGPTITAFRETITKNEESNYSSAWSITWDENEPTSWHTRRVWIESGAAQHIENIDLPNPAPGGADPSYLVEFTTYLRRSSSGPSTTSFEVETYLNDSAQFGKSAWTGSSNRNVAKTISKNNLKNPGDAGYPINKLKVNLTSDSAAPIRMDLTRFTVEYTRLLVAVDDELFFGRSAAGPSSFKISGFSNSDHAKALVWDISDKHLPKQIKIQPGNISGSGANHTYNIGRSHVANANFIATTISNVQKVKAISSYVPVNIDPASGGARWLAITHGSLKSAADELAAHRESQMPTYVVDIANIVNQTGYGFNTPETVRQYLRNAVNDWAVAPDYVTLFGDATNNPRNLDCADCSASWTPQTPNLLITDMQFVDRWQGMIPSDFALSLLFGDDLIPDIAIARLPANTKQEATNMARKVISFETQRMGELKDWQKNYLFVADNADAGGNFCTENAITGALLPDEYNQTHLCLGVPSNEEIGKLRADMSTQINDIGLSILNYRGHGSTQRWAGYHGESPILSAEDDDFWQNSGRAAIVLSADCLDGYFIQNHQEAFGETFMRLNNRGSVAHWSSSGLGYSSEHSVLHKGFYEGMFDHNQVAIGDAVNFAKFKYYQSGKHPSELYGFILLGDAAMNIVPDRQSKIFMPVTMARK